MDRSAYREQDDGEGADQPEAYWRRRAITLALGLGLIGIMAWGFSGGGAKSTSSGGPGVLPATALGTAIPGLTAPTPAPTSTPTVTPARAVSGSAGASGASGSAGASGASGPASALTPTASASRLRPKARPYGMASAQALTVEPGGRCAPGSVVLSLFTDRTSYGSSQFPRFDVYAVSTSPVSCSFDPRQLQVVVLSSGRIVWDSADCAHGAARSVQLARGVPAQDLVTWNRAITLPGCQVLASSARAGTYTVQARTGTEQSPARQFKLTQ
jgi:hypothetical protein